MVMEGLDMVRDWCLVCISYHSEGKVDRLLSFWRLLVVAVSLRR